MTHHKITHEHCNLIQRHFKAETWEWYSDIEGTMYYFNNLEAAQLMVGMLQLLQIDNSLTVTNSHNASTEYQYSVGTPNEETEPNLSRLLAIAEQQAKVEGSEV